MDHDIVRFVFGVFGNISGVLILLSPTYGMPSVSKHNVLVLTINVTGAAVESIYVLIFLIYAPQKEKARILGLLALGLSVVASVAFVSVFALHGNSRKLFAGFAACIFCVIMYASPLSIMRTVIKTRSVEYMPFSLSLFVFFGGTSWFIYGLRGNDLFLTVPNGLGCGLGAVQLIFYIRHYISQGSHKEALLAYTQFRRTGIYHFCIVPLILKACASLSLIRHGRALRCESLKMGVEYNVVVGTSLFSVYAKCGDVLCSRKVFDEMPERNVITWNAMIGGYTVNGNIKEASVLFERMGERSAVTWIETIDGFAKSGGIVIARELFERVPVGMKNVATWTVMVNGYARNGEMEAAKEVFDAMPIRNFFAWSCMVSGYCKRGDVEAAKAVFDKIPERNLVNWNSLISGLAQNGFCEEALDAFAKMQSEGFEPDEVTLASALSACANLGLLDVGKDIHETIVHKGIRLNHFILNGLVDMYAKCGDLSNARLMFEKISDRNECCWNTMISGYAIHGQFKEALELFGRMEASSERPNDLTFLSILSACAHGGFVEEGMETFAKMEKRGLTASIRHYGCIIDLLGRAGRLKEAYDLVKRMPVTPNDTGWGALLGACRVHLDTDMAERVLEEVGRYSDSGSCNDSHHLLLTNIYAASNEWEKAEMMRTIVLENRFQKAPGHSSYMHNNLEMSFCATIT
ncbi:hypothetical protein RHSIM_Rhsim11G0077400 [Rhododendron simsii]|uniref:Pentatricopeptide repeat-containing protein n=1 Tax=Rhododendron simsii TaxID=118357 RepID=A0A834L8W4_RHOSS|nr:hypothetical protein RHSIM_Rhsim11G0077400 [Rhododendron simsii]